MEYEEKCDFCMSQLVIIKYREILKILEENSNVIILKIPIEKVKSEEERRKEEEEIKNCLIFKKLKPFFLESRLCREHGTIIKRKKSKKGYYMTDNWYFYKYDRNVRKILQEYPTIYSMADWIDIYFITENKIILKTIAHEEICYGTAKLFRSLKTQ